MDNFGNLIEVIYDNPNKDCPLEYMMWSFRYSTEIGNNFDMLHSSWDYSGLKDTNVLYFFKMRNSNYIKQFDNNHNANQNLFPNLEHHLYITGDEIFEVILNYEPRFIEKDNKVSNRNLCLIEKFKKCKR